MLMKEYGKRFACDSDAANDYLSNGLFFNLLIKNKKSDSDGK